MYFLHDAEGLKEQKMPGTNSNSKSQIKGFRFWIWRSPGNPMPAIWTCNLSTSLKHTGCILSNAGFRNLYWQNVDKIYLGFLVLVFFFLKCILIN